MFSQNDQRSRRILVIDDNQDIHEDFKTVLMGAATNTTLDSLENDIFGSDQDQSGNITQEYELDFASQGADGLALVEAGLAANRPFALAFVDMRMPPGWDGLETIERLWQADPRLQIVICTAYSDYSQLDIVNRLGHSDNLLILKKPFDPEEVVQMACALVTKREMTRMAQMTLQQMENLVAERTEALARAQFHDGETRLKMEKMQDRLKDMQ
jgi:CheY-like chemotaxis protein